MYQYNCTVTRIIDGDTLDVDIDLGFSVKLIKQRIRMMGIDTPESRTRNLEEKKRGLISKQYLLDTCPIGSTIRLVSHHKGKFGRILGSIYTDASEQSINKIMCDEGFAVEYYGGSKDDLEEQHQINKQKLIDKGLL